MTKKLLERIEEENTLVYLHIEALKEMYKKDENRATVAEIRSYLQALSDLEFITDRERGCLYVYITL